MMSATILIVDDDQTLTEMLTKVFAPLGYDLLTAYNGKEGLKSAYQNHPDLIILDIMMPEMDGFEMCKRLRKMSDVPILMLTAKTSEMDVVKGLELGADDYVKKPFNVRELRSRIETLLRRKAGRGNVYDDGVLHIDLKKRLVFRKDQLIPLTPTEYRLLACLVEHRNQTLTRQDLLERVWGQGYEDAFSILSTYIHYLREKLEENPDSPEYICTIRGKGYRFVANPEKK